MNLDAWECHEFFQDLNEHTEKRTAGGYIIISGKNSSLGSGKSSLACALYYALNHHWNTPTVPSEQCHMSPLTYMDAWSAAKQKTALILDEANVFGLEAQRWQKTETLTLSHLVQVQRVKQIWTITTCGSWQHITKRVRELANYNLVCDEVPGKCVAYKIIVNFQDGKVRRKRLGQPFNYPNTEHTEAYQYLAELKDKYLEEFRENYEELSNGAPGVSENVKEKYINLGMGKVFQLMSDKNNPNLTKDERVNINQFSKGTGVQYSKCRRLRDAAVRELLSSSKDTTHIY